MIPPLTNSEMTQFMKCRRGWWLSYYRKLRRRSVESLPNIGSMYHNCLEFYYDAVMNGVELPNPAALCIEWGQDLVERYPELAGDIYKDVEMTAIMLEGYIEWVAETGADVGLRVIGAEESITIALEGTHYELRGKMDARLERESDGALLQLEHKTVADLTTIPRYAQNAPQFLTYDLLAYLKAQKEGGQATDGVIINMARRVKRTARAKPPFYARHEVRHNLDELRNHWRHVVAIAKDIELVRERLDRGYDHHDVCPPTIDRNHLWSCDCAPVTAMMDDGGDYEGYLQEVYEEYDPYERYAA